MHWKVKLEADDNTLGQLAGSCNRPNTKIIRDGVDWFLEATDFEMISDHVDVKTKAAEILNAIAGGDNIGLGPVYRLHYDNSRTVYR